jgi:nucleoside-diphosphate-sugar epimerase
MRLEAVLPRFVGAVLDGSPIVLHDGGAQIRQFVHVSDLAGGLVAALRRPDEHAIFNLTSDEVVTIRQLAELVMDVSGRRVDLDCRPGRPGDLQTAPRISAARAQTHLGWRAGTPLRDGVAGYWAWTLGNGAGR